MRKCSGGYSLVFSIISFVDKAVIVIEHSGSRVEPRQGSWMMISIYSIEDNYFELLIINQESKFQIETIFFIEMYWQRGRH